MGWRPCDRQGAGRQRSGAARRASDTEDALGDADRVRRGDPVRGLAARHAPAGPWALDGLDLDLVPGRRVGLVGPSGAGKSTLAAVLLRFLPYERGSVTLGGVELADLAGDDVRRSIGLVEQDAHVFDTTLRKNLLIARPEAEDEELRGALDRARLLEWVDHLPRGLDTDVGEHGARLSGGQRQRLAVARALLADFPVLILDEPVEHLDLDTADALTTDLLAVSEGRATLLITHRLAALPAMDEVIVMAAGRVVERGSHAELLRAEGPYARQWWEEQKMEDRT